MYKFEFQLKSTRSKSEYLQCMTYRVLCMVIEKWAKLKLVFCWPTLWIWTVVQFCVDMIYH